VLDSLAETGGIHRVVYGQHRLLSATFPYAIYYEVEGHTVLVNAVIDCRRNPTWIRKRLKHG
jgi:hypothetical protein